MILLTVANVVAFRRIPALEGKLSESSDAEHFELAAAMAQLQRFSGKLYFSGKHENWELAAFYLHEMEEQAEDIERAHLKEEEVEVAPLVQSLLESSIHAAETDVKGKNIDGFGQAYTNMITNCNACHVATKHGFVQITVPQNGMSRTCASRPSWSERGDLGSCRSTRMLRHEMQ